MDYKRFNDTIMLRVDVDEEVIESIEEVCHKEKVKVAEVTGLGALKYAELGVYHVPTKEYNVIELHEFMEMTALMGNVTTQDGEYYGHFHVNLGNEAGEAFGGHFKQGVVGGTAEIFIRIIEGAVVDRKVCDETGLNIFDFD